MYLFRGKNCLKVGISSIKLITKTKETKDIECYYEIEDFGFSNTIQGDTVSLKDSVKEMVFFL